MRACLYQGPPPCRIHGVTCKIIFLLSLLAAVSSWLRAVDVFAPASSTGRALITLSTTADNDLLATSVVPTEETLGPVKAECRLPTPPNYDYGPYALFSRLAIDAAADGALPLRGELGHVSPLLSKLASGGQGKVLVIGGSMTKGRHCEQEENGRRTAPAPCTWSARFVQWLRAAFPAASVDLANIAHGGCDSEVWSANLASWALEHRDADLVFIDTSVNDGIVAHVSKNASLADAYERLLLVVRSFIPSAGIFAIVGACRNCKFVFDEELPVLAHHGVPVLDMHPLRTLYGDEVWPWLDADGREIDDSHPYGKTHQAMADALARIFARAWASQCPGSPLPPALAPPRRPESADDKEVCLEPLSRYVAGDAASSAPTVVSGDWRMYEDRPGKPGWMASTKGSRLRFSLRFGERPRFFVTYMRSYQNISDATLRAVSDGATVLLGGLWDPCCSEQVSLSQVVWFNGMHDTAGEEQSASGLLMASVKANSTSEFEVELSQDGKAKIISVMSC